MFDLYLFWRAAKTKSSQLRDQTRVSERFTFFTGYCYCLYHLDRHVSAWTSRRVTRAYTAVFHLILPRAIILALGNIASSSPASAARAIIFISTQRQLSRSNTNTWYAWWQARLLLGSAGITSCFHANTELLCPRRGFYYLLLSFD